MRLTGAPVWVISLAFLAGCHTVGTNMAGISNFDIVDDGAIYRGGQPSAQGIEALKSRGVRTVINLRDDAVPEEQKWVEQAGMHYVFIPSNAIVVEPAKLHAFLDQLKADPQPIFVHCAQGRDRTGLAIAMHRIVDQGWSREDALRELYAHGHLWALFPGIGRFIRNFNRANYLPGTSA